MPADPNKLQQFWKELKRRKVIHVITVYAAGRCELILVTSLSSFYYPPKPWLRKTNSQHPTTPSPNSPSHQDVAFFPQMGPSVNDLPGGQI